MRVPTPRSEVWNQTVGLNPDVAMHELSDPGFSDPVSTSVKWD